MDIEALRRIAELSKTDKILGSPTRLAIMILLYLRVKMKFTDLQSILGLTPGNLSSHLKKLESAGYIEIIKGFVELKPATIIKITREGAEAVRDFMRNLGEILEYLTKEHQDLKPN